LIGNTPLIRLASFEAGLRNVELYAKAEWKNPGGSVKDRPALRMIEDGEKSGALTRDKIILDATSGNTGIAYAMIGAARGYRVKLCVPTNVTPERKRILKAFGAEIVFTDPMQGSDGAILKARELYAAEPQLYFYVDQYNNAGTGARTTTRPGPKSSNRPADASRISWPDSARAARSSARDAVSVNSTRRFADFRSTRLAAARLEGLKHMETAIVPASTIRRWPTRILASPTEEAFDLTRQLARTGLFVGISSGANLAAALQRSRAVHLTRWSFVEFSDGGEKYLS
jgi:cysteine synthase B